MMTYEEVYLITDAEVENIAASRTTSGKWTVIVMYNYSVLRMCGEGEGDCDTDSDCDIGLVCGDNNCSSQVSKHGSWIMDHGSWVMDHGSWIMDQVSRIKYQVSRIKDLGPWTWHE